MELWRGIFAGSVTSSKFRGIPKIHIGLGSWNGDDTVKTGWSVVLIRGTFKIMVKTLEWNHLTAVRRGIDVSWMRM